MPAQNTLVFLDSAQAGAGVGQRASSGELFGGVSARVLCYLTESRYIAYAKKPLSAHPPWFLHREERCVTLIGVFFCDFSLNQREPWAGGNSPPPQSPHPTASTHLRLPMFGECIPNVPTRLAEDAIRLRRGAALLVIIWLRSWGAMAMPKAYDWHVLTRPQPRCL